MHGNADYLCFVGVCAIAFLAIAYLLPRVRQGAVFPKTALGLAGAFAIVNWWSVQNAGNEAQTNIETVVRALAPTYAVELAELDHASVTVDTPADDPHYLAIVKRIQQWERVSGFAHDIYTVRRLPDGRNVFIVDPETDYDRNGKFDRENETRTKIGTPVEEADSGLDLAWQGNANFNRDVVRDQWGEWVGAWAPIFRKDGTVDAVVGVDFSAQQWLQAVTTARHHVLLRVALGMALIVMGGAAFGVLRADRRRRGEAEERSRCIEERMALTLGRMPLVFVELDAQRRCVGWNPTAERTFGYKAEEMLGREILPLIVSPSGKEHADKVWSQLFMQAGGTHSVIENMTRDGRSIVCEWFNTARADAEGNFAGVIALGQDITERINLEKHLQQAQRLNAVGQLAAGVAHDFNNILTIITGHAGLLLDHPELPADARGDLERIEDAGVRASGLTRQLLAFSRQQAMFPRPIHIGPVVENSATMLARILGEDVAFSAQIEPGLPPIEADAAMLDQVITNLVLNARDAMPRGGSIELRVESALADEAVLRKHPDATLGAAVCLVVSDSGTGIPPENLSRLFEPFFTTKQMGKGTGLGLSVVHGIVKQHHGWIDVTTEVGKGTTFRLYFPPTSEMPAEAESIVDLPEAQCEPRRRKTILLAEDEAIVRDLARMILERAGYRVLDAADGVEALKLWSEHRDHVDLLLTDMVMPNGVTGRDLSQRILADEPDLPIVYASGYSLELTAPDFCETDRQVFLPKPYLTDQLVTIVRQCLGDAQPRCNAAIAA